jgi:hypothetical protein
MGTLGVGERGGMGWDGMLGARCFGDCLVRMVSQRKDMESKDLEWARGGRICTVRRTSSIRICMQFNQARPVHFRPPISCARGGQDIYLATFSVK